MKSIPMNDMDKLLPPVEQAKMMGLIKEPEQLQIEEKQNYFLYGVSITFIFILGCFIVYDIIEKKQSKKEAKILEFHLL